MDQFDEKEEYRYFLKTMRKSIGLTIAKMSEEIGIDQSILGCWEDGRRNVPYPSYLEKKIRKVVKRVHQERRIS